MTNILAYSLLDTIYRNNYVTFIGKTFKVKGQ